MIKHKGIFGIFITCVWFGSNAAYAINTENNNTLDKEKSSAKSYKLNKVIATVSTATGFEQELKNAPASMSIITNKDLQGRPIRDLGDAISQIPGVSIDAGAQILADTLCLYAVCQVAIHYSLLMAQGKM